MPEFTLTCHVTVSATTVVEADSLDAAIAIARGRDVVLHFNGSATDPAESWCIEEADGSPENIAAG